MTEARRGRLGESPISFREGRTPQGLTLASTTAEIETMAAVAKTATASAPMSIPAANIVRITLGIEGTAPYVQHKFSRKMLNVIQQSHEGGSAGKAKKKVREARDFADDAKQATHFSEAGWVGIPAPAFRCAMIDACRTAGVVMTKAKMSVFIIADGIDADDGSPLVRLIAGEPTTPILPVRNDSGVADLRCRPMWHQWAANVTLEFDADMITQESVTNLLDRAGRQVGIGEGRPFSKESCGMGWGTFKVTGGVRYEAI